MEHPTPTKTPGKKMAAIAVCLLLVALAAASIALRVPKEDRLYINEDAPWHVLLTMQSYNAIPKSEHLMLPLVTPDDAARGIPWGATLPGEGGLYYYTSFWPAGFALPWAFATLLGLPATTGTLYVFNSLLYAGCALVAALLFARLFKGRLSPLLVGGLCAALYLFQPEILHSQGAVYWHHSVNQLLLLLQLYAFSFFSKKGGRFCFYLLCFLSPFLEWTGLVAGAGYALLLLVFGAPGDKKRPLLHRFGLAAGVGGAVLASLALTLLHYTRRLSLSAVFGAMFASYQARGDATQNPLLQFAAMYFRSFRWLWVLLGLLLVLVLALPKARAALPGTLKAFWPWLFLTLFPLLENLLLRQHTVEYSYARLKAVLPLLLLFCLLAACLWQQLQTLQWRRLAAGALALFVLGTGLYSLHGYLAAPGRYVLPAAYKTQNQQLAGELLAAFPREQSFYGTNITARGYANLLFGGGILELADYETTLAEAAARGARYAVYLVAEGGQSSSHRFISATVCELATGRVYEFLVN